MFPTSPCILVSDYQRVKARKSRRHDARLTLAVKRKSLTQPLWRAADNRYIFQPNSHAYGIVVPHFLPPCLLSLAFPKLTKAQEDSDLSDDSHFREELGINQFTTPSIEKLFDTLDSLKPIPTRDLTRAPQALRLDNRVRFSLSFHALCDRPRARPRSPPGTEPRTELPPYR